MVNACQDPKSAENQKKCEELIVNSFNEFNNKFKSYETAYLTYKKTQDSKTSNSLINDYKAMYDQLKEMEGYINSYTSKYLQKDGTTQSSQNFYNEIIEKYNNMIESRKKLDQQLYDLYTNDYDSVYSNKPFVDSTIVTGILWTLLVTFMLYYVIVKM